MPWLTATRRKIVPVSGQDKGVSNPLKWDFSKAGILAGIYLQIRGSLTGTITAPNALGKASIIRNVRVFHNSSGDIHLFSGPQYHYLIRDYLEHYIDPVPGADARSAVAAGAYNLDMWIPLAVSAIDPRGLINLQDEGVTLSLSVEFETDAMIATGITAHTCTVTPHLELFTLPKDEKDRPAFNVLHSIMSETKSIAAAGDFDYPWPLGNAYLQLMHGAGMAQSPADAWSKVILRAQQTDRMYEYVPASADMEYSRFHGRARLLGTLALDFLGSDGLGCYGGDRDLIYSNIVSDLKTTITATGATSLHCVRRMLVAA